MHSQLLTQFQSSWPWVAAISAAVLLALTAWGFVLLSVFPRLRINRSPYAFFCESLLHGFLLFSIAGTAGIFLGIRLHHTFLIGSGLAVFTWLLALRRARTNAILETASGVQSSNRLESAALMLIIAGSLIWSANSIEGLTESGSGIVLVPWADFFSHARQIGNFAQFDGDFGTLQGTMYGEHARIYHYGSYMASSLVSYVGDIPSIQVATSLYPVLGMLLTGASMFVLASATSGAGGALLAVVLLFLLPDPSCLVPGITRQYSYFFFQQVGVGGSYAVAVMGLALAYALRAFQLRSLLICAVSLFVFSVASLFKVQIVLAYSFFFFLFVIWNTDWISKERRLIFAGVFVAAFYIAALLMSKIPNAPTFVITHAGIEENVAFTLAGVQKYVEVASRFGFLSTPPYPLTPVSLLVAAIVVLSITYGILLPASALLAWKQRHVLRDRKIVSLLVLAFVSHACIRLLIADNQGFGDAAEVNRKTFVWPYFVVIFSVSSLLWSHFAHQNSSRYPRKSLLAGLTVGLFFLSALSARNLQAWPGMSHLTNVSIPAGLFESARYLRQRSAPDEVVQLCQNDRWNQLATLSERPVFIAKVTTYGSEMSAQERERFGFVDRILHQSDLKGAASLSRQAAISWMLMSPNCSAKWEREVPPFFSADGYRLYKSSGF